MIGRRCRARVDARPSRTTARGQSPVRTALCGTRASGAWVFSSRVHEPDTATVVRVSDGELLITDGPFAESKDHLGGFRVTTWPPALSPYVGLRPTCTPRRWRWPLPRSTTACAQTCAWPTSLPSSGVSSDDSR